MKEIIAFIQAGWDKTIRSHTEDSGDLIGLPNPYTVPCISDKFQEMYYWDTYFTNVGLLLSGRLEQAKNNVENMAYLIRKFGYMPNGNRTYYLSRSQPPFFSQMVREVYEQIQDEEWLCKMYQAAEKEYFFWQSRRMTVTDLNRYYGEISLLRQDAAQELVRRFGINEPVNLDETNQYTKCMLSFSESGWDCNSRFGLRAHEFNPVDLNALLYGMEINMAYFTEELRNGFGDFWREKAAVRKMLVNKHLWDSSCGCYYDYNFVSAQRGKLVSAAAFYPLFVRLCETEQAMAVVRCLEELEGPYGVAATQNTPELLELQWDHPHGWACLQYIVIKGLLNYGYDADALRIAEKYCRVVEKNFAATGDLWEKYNTVTGEVSVTKEYDSPQMMGWSAGVYLYCCHLLEQ